MANKTFNKRKMAVLVLLATFIMMPISGIVVHFTHRSVAISHDWLHVHVLFGIIFMIAGVYHLIYNWKVLKQYLVGKKQASKS